MIHVETPWLLIGADAGSAYGLAPIDYRLYSEIESESPAVTVAPSEIDPAAPLWERREQRDTDRLPPGWVAK